MNTVSQNNRLAVPISHKQITWIVLLTAGDEDTASPVAAAGGQKQIEQTG